MTVFKGTAWKFDDDIDTGGGDDTITVLDSEVDGSIDGGEGNDTIFIDPSIINGDDSFQGFGKGVYNFYNRLIVSTLNVLITIIRLCMCYSSFKFKASLNR